ncbi:MAG: efflux RND transporter periplasmic adaptor subunit [Planctomycetaceae bacterium]|nr:efflux RND transporter periplasmic adaptor subunit [Planctomycetaceae bacterium]
MPPSSPPPAEPSEKPAPSRTAGLRGDRTFLVLITTIAAAFGLAGGLFIPQSGVRGVVSGWLADESTGDTSAAESPEQNDLFEVSLAAIETYGVNFARVEDQPTTYTQYFSVPAFVRERPTTSNLQASSRMSGVVRRIFVQVGQSVREGDPLVELELTGDELASAQSLLLDSVQQLKIIDDEIARLQPASADGGIARKNLIEKQYEQRRMKSVIEAKRQELLIRGLAEEDVDAIIREQQLVRSVVIRVPRDIRPETPPGMTQRTNGRNSLFQLTPHDERQPVGPWVYSVESMRVSPGSVLQAGQAVSDLAYHETLLIEGQAYERDLETLTGIINDQLPVSIEIGDDASPVVIDDLRVLFMDNHVDDETQTYRFYIEVPNEVLAENINSQQRRFRTWRFKPGQRGHVRIPMHTLENLVVLPAEAVTEEGVDSVVFRRIAIHDHFHGDTPPHAELKKLVVSVRYRDQRTVVIDHRNQLSPKQTIAVSQADMLLRASSEGGGHGHDHGHEH